MNDYLYDRWNSPVIEGNVVQKNDCMVIAANPNNEQWNNRMIAIRDMMLHGY